MPATIMEATATIVMLSMASPWRSCCFKAWALGCLARVARCGRDVDRGEDAEDVGLHHSGEQPEVVMTIGSMWSDREQDANDHPPAHHVAEQADGQGQRGRTR